MERKGQIEIRIGREDEVAGWEMRDRADMGTARRNGRMVEDDGRAGG